MTWHQTGRLRPASGSTCRLQRYPVPVLVSRKYLATEGMPALQRSWLLRALAGEAGSGCYRGWRGSVFCILHWYLQGGTLRSLAQPLGFLVTLVTPPGLVSCFACALFPAFRYRLPFFALRCGSPLYGFLSPPELAHCPAIPTPSSCPLPFPVRIPSRTQSILSLIDSLASSLLSP